MYGWNGFHRLIRIFFSVLLRFEHEFQKKSVSIYEIRSIRTSIRITTFQSKMYDMISKSGFLNVLITNILQNPKPKIQNWKSNDLFNLGANVGIIETKQNFFSIKVRKAAQKRFILINIPLRV
jgi:hypothetical protein